MRVRILDSLLLLLICIRPLIAYPVFTQLDHIINVLFVLLSFVYLSISRKISRVAFEPVFFLFILSLLASLLLFPQPQKRFPIIGIYMFYIGLLYFSYFEEGKKYYPAILLIGSVLVCLYALRIYFLVSGYTLAYMSRHKLSYSFAEEFILRKRAFAPFILPNLLGGYLAMIIPLCTGVIIEELKVKKKNFILSLAIICLFLSSAVLLLTKSIGAWLSLMCAACLFFLITKTINKRIIAVLLLILSILTATFIFRQKGADFTTAGFSLGKRLDYWRRTAEIIAAHPLKGTGVGNFSLPESRFAHNSYLQIWAEAGILAFLSYLAIIFIFLNKGIKAIKECPDWRLAGFFIAGLVFIIHNLFDFTFFIPQVSFLWWICLGCVLGYPRGFYPASVKSV